jgi:Spy/CpxP family protein refolding chaperone
MKENDMKKLAYVIAAISAIAVAAPSIASAETVVIKRHGHHDWHHDWHHHDRTVVIKSHRHEG